METIAALIQELGDSDRQQREYRIERLVRFGEAAVDPLCEALAKGGLLKKCAAAAALGRIGDRRAVPALLRSVDDSETSVREYAIIALGQLRDPAAVPRLGAIARGWNEFLVGPAVEALGEIGDVRALDPLVKVLLGGGEAHLQIAAARALGRIGHPAAVPPLCQSLERGGAGELIEASRALGRIGDVRAVPALCSAAERAAGFSSRDSILAAITAALVRIGTASLPELGSRLRYDWSAPIATRSLAEFGSVAVPVLAEALRQGSSVVKLRALDVLDTISQREPEAARAAVEVLTDKNPEVRAVGVRLAGKLRDRSLLPRIRPLLSDPDRRVAGRATLAVCCMGERSPTLAYGLAWALDDPHPGVAQAAAQWLEQFARECPSPALLSALPALRRRSGVFQRASPNLQTACRAALAAIEGAAHAFEDLPLPASESGTLDLLPIPSEPVEPSHAGLPIPDLGPPEKQ